MRALPQGRCCPGPYGHSCSNKVKVAAASVGTTKTVDIGGYKQSKLAECEACMLGVMDSIFSKDIVEGFGGDAELLSCLESLSQKLHDCNNDELNP